MTTVEAASSCSPSSSCWMVTNVLSGTTPTTTRRDPITAFAGSGGRWHIWNGSVLSPLSRRRRPPPQRGGRRTQVRPVLAALPPPTLEEIVDDPLMTTTRTALDFTTETTTMTTTTTPSFADSDVLQLSPEVTVAIFVIGLIPFAVATIEFWRRIAVGEPFGTGRDSVIIPGADSTNTTTMTTTTTTFIGKDNAPQSSRGRRILGKDALIAAYFLFAVAAAVLALVMVSVLTSDPVFPTVVDL